MPAPRPRHPNPKMAYSPRHARAMPAPPHTSGAWWAHKERSTQSCSSIAVTPPVGLRAGAHRPPLPGDAHALHPVKCAN
eukprot:gene24745-biopygen4436